MEKKSLTEKLPGCIILGVLVVVIIAAAVSKIANSSFVQRLFEPPPTSAPTATPPPIIAQNTPPVYEPPPQSSNTPLVISSATPTPEPTTITPSFPPEVTETSKQEQEKNESIQPISITMNNGVLSVNGRILKLPLDVRYLETIWGKVSRVHQNANNIYTWDEIGIYCYGRGASSEITGIDIALTSAASDSPDFHPYQAFKGFLYVDGILLDSNSNILEVNKRKTGKPFVPSSLLGVWMIRYTDTVIYWGREFSSDYNVEFSVQ